MTEATTQPTQLVWFRRDLRVIDNPALDQACRQRAQRGAVVAVVTLTPTTWLEHDASGVQYGFWLERLRWLAARLAALNIPLKVLHADQFARVPQALEKLCRELDTRALYFNYEYPLDERHRDRAVCETLGNMGVECEGFHGELLIPPGRIVNGKGEPYRVFTPFANRWRTLFPHFDQMLYPRPEVQSTCLISSDPLPATLALGAHDLGYRTDLWPVDDESILTRLHDFCEQREEDYARYRDFPAVIPEHDGTSRMSPYLAVGALSPRQCIYVLREAYAERGGDTEWLQGSWLNELVWREFYRHLLLAYPEMSRMEPFKPEIEARIQWQHDEQAFEAWCQGRTGFPIVDAAMKQLHETGWMHNRLRMVVSSFLTKLMRIDWRLGERYFMSRLIDADFASNLGGWQWSASVGADAAPYFRIFNPQTQGEKFDPEGRFVAHYLPQLSRIDGKKRQQPGAAGITPIIDYKAAREQSLADYKSAE